MAKQQDWAVEVVIKAMNKHGVPFYFDDAVKLLLQERAKAVRMVKKARKDYITEDDACNVSLDNLQDDILAALKGRG